MLPTAKKMKEISDKNYLQRYEEYIKEIEESICESANKGFYHMTYILYKSECQDWTRSPLFDYFEGLKTDGYQIEVTGKEELFEIEIAWR